MNREQNDISALDNSKRSLMIEFSNTKDFNKSQTNISLSEKRHATKKNYHFLNRVCCIRVNRKWMIKKQIFVTTSVVFLVVLSIVTAFIGVNKK